MDQHRAPISYTPEPCSDSREEVQNLQAKCLRIQAERDRFKNALWALRAEFIALQAKAEGLELERDELKDTLGAKQRSQSSFTVNGYTSRSAPAAGNGESSNSHVSATMEQPMRLPSTLAAAQIMPYEAYAQIGGWAGHPSNNVASASNGSANPSKSSTQSTVLKPSPLPSPATHAPRHTLVPVTKGRKAKAPAKPAPASKTAEKRPVRKSRSTKVQPTRQQEMMPALSPAPSASASRSNKRRSDDVPVAGPSKRTRQDDPSSSISGIRTIISLPEDAGSSLRLHFENMIANPMDFDMGVETTPPPPMEDVFSPQLEYPEEELPEHAPYAATYPSIDGHTFGTATIDSTAQNPDFFGHGGEQRLDPQIREEGGQEAATVPAVEPPSADAQDTPRQEPSLSEGLVEPPQPETEQPFFEAEEEDTEEVEVKMEVESVATGVDGTADGVDTVSEEQQEVDEEMIAKVSETVVVPADKVPEAESGQSQPSEGESELEKDAEKAGEPSSGKPEPEEPQLSTPKNRAKSTSAAGSRSSSRLSSAKKSTRAKTQWDPVTGKRIHVGQTSRDLKMVIRLRPSQVSKSRSGLVRK